MSAVRSPRMFKQCLPSLIVALLGLGLTAGVVYQQVQAVHMLAQVRFSEEVRSSTDALAQRIVAIREIVAGMRDLFLIDPGLRRDQFEDIAAGHEMRSHYPELINLSFVRWVPAADLPGYRARLGAAADIHPLREQADYYVVEYLWPLEGNEGVAGLEISSQPANLAALLAGRNTRLPTVSAPFRLLQETPDRTGFLLRYPSLRSDSKDSAQPDFIGSVAAVLRTNQMLDAVRTSGFLRGLSLTLTDRGQRGEPLPDGSAGAEQGGLLLGQSLDPASEAIPDPQRETRVLNILDRRWQLDFVQARAMASAGERRLSWWMGLAGGALSLLLAGLTWMLCGLRLRAVSQAASTNVALRHSEEEIRYLAYNDPLTGLPNRRLLLDRLQQALAASQRRRRYGALLMLDLDHFKTINETRGHDAGDDLLRQVAGRLRERLQHFHTVARHGDDEFVVVLEDLSDRPEEAAARAEDLGRQIMQALRTPYLLDGEFCHSSVSMGASLFLGQETAADEQLRRADLAMYQAKAAGRNTLQFYDPHMQAVVHKRVALELDMRVGLDQNQFELFYQPQLDQDGIIGCEALLRWNHPRDGYVSPAAFIPLAEDSGLILPLGDWVLRAACRQLAAWAGHPVLSAIRVAVNVSPRQFRQPDFVDQVMAALAGAGADARRLELELTEGLLLQNIEDTIEKMVRLKGYGVGFSLDDFGTGYSSLAYLKRLPLDQLKIDQSFVRDVLTDPNDAAIARAIVTLGLSLGLRVIAEGVETEEQRAFLQRHQCHAWQGYLFSPPVPVADFEALAARGGSSAQA